MTDFLHALVEEIPSSVSLNVNDEEHVDPEPLAEIERFRPRLPEIVLVAERLLPERTDGKLVDATDETEPEPRAVGAGTPDSEERDHVKMGA
jgi:hypothetical protein